MFAKLLNFLINQMFYYCLEKSREIFDFVLKKMKENNLDY